MSNQEHAFPAHPSALGDHNGMTLRDYFAAKAMQAGLTGATLPGLDSGNPAAVEAVQRAAVAFYVIADAMVAARERA
jgi:hypothetical protein